jgi:hypothetical protein
MVGRIGLQKRPELLELRYGCIAQINTSELANRNKIIETANTTLTKDWWGFEENVYSVYHAAAPLPGILKKH